LRNIDVVTESHIEEMGVCLTDVSLL